MSVRISCAMLLACLAVPTAQASSFYHACLEDAREAYRYCRDVTGDRYACRQEYQAERHHCARIERRVERDEATPLVYGSPPGRFVPIPIPQRMPYILPGMR